MKTIVLCLNSQILNAGYRDKGICARYPGASWLPEFTRLAESKGYPVYSGHEFMRSNLSAKGAVLIQEEDNAIGEYLAGNGAVPEILYCMESPIFTPAFYDKLPELKARFKKQMLFDGGTDYLHFPNFNRGEIKEPVKWELRRPLVMVSANKHYKAMTAPKDSPAWDYAIANQLHDSRYNAISYFKSIGMLDLYGHAWPSDWGKACDDKAATVSNYGFALCFENGAYPGYVTEKIVDCFVAGVIPLYLGAPDIERHLPTASYVDARKFASIGEAWQAASTMGETRAKEIIAAGQAFLGSPLGDQYSNQGFAENMLKVTER